MRRCVLQLPPREDTSASRLSWVARIRTWTSRSRADRATVTPRPKKPVTDASSPPPLPSSSRIVRSDDVIYSPSRESGLIQATERSAWSLRLAA